MINFDQIPLELLKGFVVGICCSAPVGPLGVLCIQRTISRGRWHGVVTGLGATTSDLIYAIMVSVSMAFITDFIDAHLSIIQLFGAVVIGAFGIHIYRSKPIEEVEQRKKRKKPHKHMPEEKQPPYWRRLMKNQMFHDYITAFGLCFSNPLIIFLFIGLFAQFHVMSTSSHFINVLTLFALLVGAFCWWLTLTYIVGRFRGNFKQRGLRILNHITGGILIAAAVATAVKAVIDIL